MGPFLWNGKASPYEYGDALVLGVTSTFWDSSPGPTYHCDGYACWLSSGEFGMSIRRSWNDAYVLKVCPMEGPDSGPVCMAG